MLEEQTVLVTGATDSANALLASWLTGKLPCWSMAATPLVPSLEDRSALTHP